MIRQFAATVALTLTALVLTGSAIAAVPDFGSNVVVFDPSMSTSQIQATVDAIAAQQVPNEFGTQRYALLFKPGTYGTAADPLNFQVGYYTSVAGLGRSPGDVVINGSVYARNQCVGRVVHRADEFLAIAVEPHDQRHHARFRVLQR